MFKEETACKEDLNDSMIIKIEVLYVRCNVTGISSLSDQI